MAKPIPATPAVRGEDAKRVFAPLRRDAIPDEARKARTAELLLSSKKFKKVKGRLETR